jgi:hypothetical protein
MTAAFSFLALAVLQGNQPADKAAMVPSDFEIRQMLRVDEFKAERQFLIKLGEAAFPAYLRILTAADARPEEASRIYHVLPHVNGNRAPFLEHAIGALASPEVYVRRPAVILLAEIGSAEDEAPIVSLLSDEDWTVGIAAAKALAKIGDRRALTAMDVWLNSSSPGRHRNEQLEKALRKHIAKYRDELKQRLEKEKK